MFRRLAAIVLVLAAALPLFAQARAGEDLLAIQDNSFLVEEAYNQEAGVVQHISVFTRDRRTHDWGFTFTQEWPAPSLTHQLSYTAPFANSKLGDVALNYRYQLLGNGESITAIAPRVTLMLPTAKDSDRGGIQAALPISHVYASRIAGHTDIGFTHMRDGNVTSIDLAQSFIYALNGRVHLMLESTYSRVNHGEDDTLLVSPGVRWAYNFKNGLQIVPGVALPIGVGPTAGERSVLLYLSFEHPFRH